MLVSLLLASLLGGTSPDPGSLVAATSTSPWDTGGGDTGRTTDTADTGAPADTADTGGGDETGDTAPPCDSGDTGCDSGTPPCDSGDTGCDTGTPPCDSGDTGCDTGTPPCDSGDTACVTDTAGCDTGDTGCVTELALTAVARSGELGGCGCRTAGGVLPGSMLAGALASALVGLLFITTARRRPDREAP